MDKNIRTEGTAFKCSPTQKTNFWDIYKTVKDQCSSIKTIALSGTILNLKLIFIRFLLHMFHFPKQTATTLTSSAFIPYEIHAVLLHTTQEKREWLINNEYTLIGLSPVSISDFNK